VPESSVVMPMGFGLTGPVDIVLESSFGILLVDEVVSTPIVVSPVSWVGAFDISAASTDDGFAQGVFSGKFSDLSCFSGIYHYLAGFWWGGPGGAPYCSGESLIRHGFFGPRAVSPSLVVLKEVSPVPKGKESTSETELVASPSLPMAQKGVQSSVAAILLAS
jgi:hypothetical protein